MTSLSTHMSLLLLFHNVGIMLGSNKANMDKVESMERHSLLHEAWDGEMFCELGLSFCLMNHLISCISCIHDDVGKHVVVTWNFIEDEGHLTT